MPGTFTVKMPVWGFIPSVRTLHPENVMTPSCVWDVVLWQAKAGGFSAEKRTFFNEFVRKAFNLNSLRRAISRLMFSISTRHSSLLCVISGKKGESHSTFSMCVQMWISRTHVRRSIGTQTVMQLVANASNFFLPITDQFVSSRWLGWGRWRRGQWKRFWSWDGVQLFYQWILRWMKKLSQQYKNTYLNDLNGFTNDDISFISFNRGLALIMCHNYERKETKKENSSSTSRKSWKTTSRKLWKKTQTDVRFTWTACCRREIIRVSFINGCSDAYVLG